jgi:acyl-CoA synthetase (AMP-forming)/AMP-acid ligase II
MADPPTLDPLAAYAAGAADRVAVVEADAATTYAALNAEVNRLANGLRSLGVEAGDVGVWCAPNSREVLAFMHASRKLGLVAVPMSYRLTPAEMGHILGDSGAPLVVVDAEQAPAVAGLAAGLPSLRHVVTFRGRHPGCVAWDDLLAAAGEDEPPPPQTDALGIAMMYTSGTTGRPKGAVRSRTDRGLLAAMLAELRFGHEEVHITTGPLYHAGPNAFALITHLTGGTVVVLRHFDPAEWARLVRRHRVTSTFCTPTHLKRLLALPADALSPADLSAMRTLIVNAAPVPYALKQEAVARLGEGFLYEVYGSTELGIDTVLRPEDQLRKPGSCGRPYGGIEVLVAGPDGRPLPAGEVGELYFRTAMAVDGYRSAGDELAELAGGWKSVGDIGYVDGEGYVYVCDRRSDLIITGGTNVYPAEVEAVLHEHPDVCDAAVVGLPDDEWGERVHAVVQPWPGRTPDLAAVEAFAAARLAGYKRPRSWEVREELPRTESGKLLRRVLRAEHRPAP